MADARRGKGKGGGGELTIVLKIPSEKDGEAAVEEGGDESGGSGGGDGGSGSSAAVTTTTVPVFVGIDKASDGSINGQYKLLDPRYARFDVKVAGKLEDVDGEELISLIGDGWRTFVDGLEDDHMKALEPFTFGQVYVVKTRCGTNKPPVLIIANESAPLTTPNCKRLDSSTATTRAGAAVVLALVKKEAWKDASSSDHFKAAVASAPASTSSSSSSSSSSSLSAAKDNAASAASAAAAGFEIITPSVEKRGTSSSSSSSSSSSAHFAAVEVQPKTAMMISLTRLTRTTGKGNSLIWSESAEYISEVPLEHCSFSTGDSPVDIHDALCLTEQYTRGDTLYMIEKPDTKTKRTLVTFPKYEKSAYGYLFPNCSTQRGGITVLHLAFEKKRRDGDDDDDDDDDDDNAILAQPTCKTRVQLQLQIMKPGNNGRLAPEGGQWISDKCLSRDVFSTDLTVQKLTMWVEQALARDDVPRPLEAFLVNGKTKLVLLRMYDTILQDVVHKKIRQAQGKPAKTASKNAQPPELITLEVEVTGRAPAPATKLTAAEKRNNKTQDTLQGKMQITSALQRAGYDVNHETVTALFKLHVNGQYVPNEDKLEDGFFDFHGIRRPQSAPQRDRRGRSEGRHRGGGSGGGSLQRSMYERNNSSSSSSSSSGGGGSRHRDSRSRSHDRSHRRRGSRSRSRSYDGSLRRGSRSRSRSYDGSRRRSSRSRSRSYDRSRRRGSRSRSRSHDRSRRRRGSRSRSRSYGRSHHSARRDSSRSRSPAPRMGLGGAAGGVHPNNGPLPQQRNQHQHQQRNQQQMGRNPQHQHQHHQHQHQHYQHYQHRQHRQHHQHHQHHQHRQPEAQRNREGKEVCRRWLHGQCQRGDKCKYVHDYPDFGRR